MPDAQKKTPESAGGSRPGAMSAGKTHVAGGPSAAAGGAAAPDQTRMKRALSEPPMDVDAAELLPSLPPPTHSEVDRSWDDDISAAMGSLNEVAPAAAAKVEPAKVEPAKIEPAKVE